MSWRGNLDRRLLAGIGAIVATVCAMALADAVVKQASSDMTLWQIYVTRSLLVVPILLAVARWSFLVDGLKWVMLRSLALTLMYIGIYTAIPLLDLSVIAASLYTAPLFIVVLSAIFLREPISSLSWRAIGVGFLGVFLIVKPVASDFTPCALVPILAGFLYACAAVITKAKCAHAPAHTLALWLNATLLVFGAVASLLVDHVGVGGGIDYPFLFGPWNDTDWRTIFVLALLMTGISIGLAKAYQSPRPHIIATFDYTYVFFAGLWGFVFFRETPSILNLVGMLLIGAAGAIACYADADVSGRKARRA